MNTVNKVKQVKYKSELIKTKYPIYDSDILEEPIDDINKFNVSINDMESNFDTIQIKTSNNSFFISYCGETTNHCCGIVELGNLKISGKPIISEITKILDKLVTSSQNQKTGMINTNGKDASIHFEAALAKCKHWKLVKTFKNPSSKNTIKMWVSNN